MGWQQVGGDERGDLRVLVRTGRREHTTATLVAWRDRAVLVDPSWDPDELADIAGRVRAEGLVVVAGVATHAHHDHVLWHPGFGTAPRWASPAAAEHSRRELAALPGLLGPGFPAELLALAGHVRPLNGDRVPWPGPELRLVVHDAHSPGHAALWLPAAGVLLAGDMLSDAELPLPDDRPEAAHHALADYAAGLRVLRPFVERAAVLVPGHGSVSRSPRERWTADERYLDAVLAGRDPQDPRATGPGMAQVHRATMRLAASARGGGQPPYPGPRGDAGRSAHLEDGLDLDR